MELPPQPPAESTAVTAVPAESTAISAAAVESTVALPVGLAETVPAAPEVAPKARRGRPVGRPSKKEPTEESKKRAGRRAKQAEQLVASREATQAAKQVADLAELQAEATSRALAAQAAAITENLIKHGALNAAIHANNTAFLQSAAASSATSVTHQPLVGEAARAAEVKAAYVAARESPEVGESVPCPAGMDLNRTPATGDSAQLHSKAPRPFPTVDAPVPCNLFGETTEPPFLGEAMGQEDMNTIIDEGTTQARVSIEAEPLFQEELIIAASGVSRRTGAYTEEEDLVVCLAWMEISQDPICGAMQKGPTFWRRVHDHFHLHRKLAPFNFFSDRNQTSIQKRWGLISAECSKFSAAYDHITRRRASGEGVGDVIVNAMKYFRSQNENKPFTLMHAWKEIRKCAKWQDIYEAYKKDHKLGTKEGSSVVDEEAGDGQGNSEGRPKGQKASKADLVRGANAVALQSTLKVLIADKEVASERKRKDREEQHKNFMEHQARRLELDEEKIKAKFELKQKETELKLKEVELNAIAREKEVELKGREVELNAQAIANDFKLKEREVELKLLAEENHIMTVDTTDMEPNRKAWIERKRKAIMDRDA